MVTQQPSDEPGPRPGRVTLQWISPALSLAVVAVIWGISYVEKLVSGFSNVDDYQYALQSQDYLTGILHGMHGIAASWRTYASNSPLLPTLAAPLTAISPSPFVVVLVQFPVLLGLTAVIAWLLGRFDLSPSRRWVGAAVVVALPMIVQYAVMINFSTIASLCTVGALAAYIASNRLRRLPLAILFGVFLGFLIISRVVGPLYALALLLPMAIDFFLNPRELGRRISYTLIAILVATVIAAPWWIICGGVTLSYLKTAGLPDRGSSYYRDGSYLDKVVARLSATSGEIGIILVSSILVGVVLAVVIAFRRKDIAVVTTGPTTLLRRRTVLLTLAPVLLGLLAFSVSSNEGTAFTLPMVVLLATTAVAWIIGPGPFWIAQRVTRAVIACVIVLQFVPITPPLLGSQRLWIQGSPAAEQLKQALGCDCATRGREDVNAAVVSIVGRAPTVVLRQDAILNGASLLIHARMVGSEFAYAPLKTRDYVGTDSKLEPKFVVTGRTPAPYSQISLPDSEAALRQAGYQRVYDHALSSLNRVTVWENPGA